jgi:hypothetical protein
MIFKRLPKANDLTVRDLGADEDSTYGLVTQ